MSTYKLLETERLTLNCSIPLKGMYKLSPYVWEEEGKYRMLIRAVNPSHNPTQKVARIYYGESADGITFNMDDGPVITPGVLSASKDGVEDPTVVCLEDGYLVYFTGWNQTKLEGQLLYSKGESIHKLEYEGEALVSHGDYLNPKEATVARLKNGKWGLFFEYANQNRSKLGKAVSSHPHGPWRIGGEFLPARPKSWDSYHISTGPIVLDSLNESVMFYNGADNQAHWRIGWVTMDDAGKIKARSTDPLITPPPNKRTKSDIAFAASAVSKDKEIWLYYSTQDQFPCRALIEVVEEK